MGKAKGRYSGFGWDEEGASTFAGQTRAKQAPMTPATLLADLQPEQVEVVEIVRAYDDGQLELRNGVTVAWHKNGRGYIIHVIKPTDKFETVLGFEMNARLQKALAEAAQRAVYLSVNDAREAKYADLPRQKPVSTHLPYTNQAYAVHVFDKVRSKQRPHNADKRVEMSNRDFTTK